MRVTIIITACISISIVRSVHINQWKSNSTIITYPITTSSQFVYTTKEGHPALEPWRPVPKGDLIQRWDIRPSRPQNPADQRQKMDRTLLQKPRQNRVSGQTAAYGLYQASRAVLVQPALSQSKRPRYEPHHKPYRKRPLKGLKVNLPKIRLRKPRTKTSAQHPARAKNTNGQDNVKRPSPKIEVGTEQDAEDRQLVIAANLDQNNVNLVPQPPGLLPAGNLIPVGVPSLPLPVPDLGGVGFDLVSSVGLFCSRTGKCTCNNSNFGRQKCDSE